MPYWTKSLQRDPVKELQEQCGCTSELSCSGDLEAVLFVCFTLPNYWLMWPLGVCTFQGSRVAGQPVPTKWTHRCRLIWVKAHKEPYVRKWRGNWGAACLLQSEERRPPLKGYTGHEGQGSLENCNRKILPEKNYAGRGFILKLLKKYS